MSIIEPQLFDPTGLVKRLNNQQRAGILPLEIRAPISRVQGKNPFKRFLGRKGDAEIRQRLEYELYRSCLQPMFSQGYRKIGYVFIETGTMDTGGSEDTYY